MFGMVSEGPRGFDLPVYDTDPDDLANYGIDWAALSDRSLMRHHVEHNPDARADDPPFSATSRPSHMSHIPVDGPNCVLRAEQVRMLDTHLHAHFDLHSRDMLVRRNMWCSALDYCKRLSAVYAVVTHA